jgi:hypothetical protein
MRVSCTALANAAGPVSANPPTTTPTIHGAAKMPRATSTATSSDRSPNTAPATRSASSRRPSPRSRAYTGMKEAESTPSPKRFCRTLGMRSAAVKAPASAELPR